MTEQTRALADALHLHLPLSDEDETAAVAFGQEINDFARNAKERARAEIYMLAIGMLFALMLERGDELCPLCTAAVKA